MLGFLRQATASQTRIVGPFIDDTDFKTLETALTIANTDVKLSANGGTSANKNSGGGTHIVNGNYALTFDATDTATVGELHVSILVAGALVVVAKFTVLEEAVYDNFFAASAVGPLTAAQVNAEVVDCLNTDTYAEPAQGAPGATITLAQKIGYLYKFLRNRKTATASQISVYGDDATTVDHKSSISDNGTTYDEGEFASGP